MARFINTADYSALIRQEIKQALIEYSGDVNDPADDDAKLLKAEDMAVSQVKNYLFGHYDVDKVFQTDIPADRNDYIVMLVIDCALYHLYTSIAPDKIPSTRSDRYQDAINWLKDVARGVTKADLPTKTDSNGNEVFPFRISSERKNEDNKW